MTTSGRNADAVTTDVAEITALITRWVTHGWHLERGQRFDFRSQLEHFYDWEATDAFLHDNADPHCTLTRSAADYAAIWDTSLTTLVALNNTVDDGPHVTVSGDLAVVDVCFSTRFEFDDGRVDVAPTRSTLALRRKGLQWRIFREHGSALSPHA
ncbi:nuclear transport factor 2 family protein [Mycolicibacterium thermoresistibile]